jgi:hypothetical protein
VGAGFELAAWFMHTSSQRVPLATGRIRTRVCASGSGESLRYPCCMTALNITVHDQPEASDAQVVDGGEAPIHSVFIVGHAEGLWRGCRLEWHSCSGGFSFLS